MKFRAAVIGCGELGRQHARGWAGRSDAEVAVVYDPARPAAESLAGEVGAAVCDSYQAAITRDGVNVVSVCTPACFHSEVACFAASAGRHVLTEKPLALTLEQADAAIAVAKNSGVKLAVSFQYRCAARHLLCREKVRNGEFGGTIFARFYDIRDVRLKLAMHRRSMNGGPVIDMAGHYFDLMRFYTGREPLSVRATGQVFGRGKRRLAGIDDLAIDAADILVEMAGGHALSVFVNWGMPEGFQTLQEELLCGPELAMQWVDEKLLEHRGGKVEALELPSDKFAGSGGTIDDLVGAIRDDRQPAAGGPEGRIALRVSLAALESIETGREVSLA